MELGDILSAMMASGAIGEEGLLGSLMGKIPGKILQRGLAHNIPVMALAGCVEDKEQLIRAGFQRIYATKPEDMALEEAMKREVALQNIQNCILGTD